MFVVIALCALTVVDSPKEKPFKPTAVFSGTHSQIKKERFEQVLDAKAWKKLWTEHRGKDGSRFTETHQEFEIDFETHYIIAIFEPGAEYITITPRLREVTLVIGFRREYISTEGGPLGNVQPPTSEEIELAEKKRAEAPYTFIVLARANQDVVIEQNTQNTRGEPAIWKFRVRFSITDERKK